MGLLMTDRNETSRIATGEAWAWRDAALLLRNSPGRPPSQDCAGVSADAYTAQLDEITAYLTRRADDAKAAARVAKQYVQPIKLWVACAFCGLGYDTAVRETCPHCGYKPAPTFVCASCGMRYNKEPNEDDKDCPDCGYTNYYDKPEDSDD